MFYLNIYQDQFNDERVAEEEKLLKVVASDASKEIRNMLTDVIVLSQNSYLKAYMDDMNTSTLNSASDFLADFLVDKAYYYQFSFVDPTGQTLLSLNNNAASPVIDTSDDLPYIGKESYFQEMSLVDKGGTYISPLEIDQNQDISSEQAVIRIAKKMYDSDNNYVGIIILNYAGENIAKNLLELNRLDSQSEYYIVDHNGDYMFSVDPSKNWSAYFDDRDSFKLYYPDAYNQMKDQVIGDLNQDKLLLVYLSLDYTQTENSNPLITQALQNAYLVSSTDKTRFDTIILIVQIILGLIGIILTVIIFLLYRQRSILRYADKIRDIMLQGIDKNPSVAILTDKKGRIIYVNETFEKVTGYSYEDAYGKKPSILKSNNVPKETYAQLWKTILSGKSWEGEFHNRCKDGTYYWAQARISAIHDKKGHIEHFFSLQNDVTKVKDLMKKVNDLAIKDPLTGAFNRNIYNDQKSEDALKKVKFYQFQGALMIDIDFFKVVNDTYGHQVGDFVLEGLADVIRDNIRENDILIRYGGEEFLILLQESDKTSTLYLAERIRKKVEAYPFLVEDITLNITVSIGISMIIPEDQSFDDIIGRVDKALYYAKNHGRNQAIDYDDITKYE